MNLLPKSHSEFHSPQYWDQFFQKRGTKAFEWYGEYPELCGILHKYIKVTDKLLVVGCGNSQLSENLYDVGYHNITNIDISDTVIRQMTDKSKTSRPDMKFMKMDVMKMNFTDGEFSVVLDKGTLDALMIDDSAQVVQDIDTMFIEIGRVLKQGGRYICISLLQDHIMRRVLSFFPEIGWPVRIHKVNTEDSENKEKEFNMPVFAMVLTKFKKLPNMKQILEVGSNEDKIERFETTEMMSAVLKEMQYYALMRQQIKSREMVGEQVSLNLYSGVSGVPRYTLYIVDNADQKPTKKFAIFIVPEGRETEWTFNTQEGRQQLSKSAGFKRLVVVTLNRAHTYTTLDSIKSELSPHVLELAPPDQKSESQVPYLSMGNNMGSRTVQHTGKSKALGDLVVEDVEIDAGQMKRRLVFIDKPEVSYSEAKLKTEKRKKKGKEKGKWIIDKSCLCSEKEQGLLAGLSFLSARTGEAKASCLEDIKVIIVEGKSASLPVFLHHHLPQVHIDVVFPESEVLQVATDWFGFIQDNNMKAICCDMSEFVTKGISEGLQVDALLMDLDYISLPTSLESFLQTSHLVEMQKLLLPKGVLVCSCKCDADTKKTLIQKLSSCFPVIFSKTIEDTPYSVTFAINNSMDSTEIFKTAEKTSVYLNSLLQNSGKDKEIDLCEMLKDITLCD